MGSLMAGWDSPPVLESKSSDIYKRNHSLTNEEIEAFWRSIKNLDHEKQHHIIVDDTIYEEKTATVKKSDVKKFQRSNTVPPAGTRSEMQGRHLKYFVHGETETMASTAHKLPGNTGWWTRSNWAFLNEPPTLLEDTNGTRTRYASQFHVANSSGGSVNGINT